MNISKFLSFSKHQLFFVVSLILVILVATHHKSLFTKSNQAHLSDQFFHSQWFIPLSPRVISDSTLYHYSSVFFANGGLLTNLSPEVPPLGRYLYALTYKVNQRPLTLNILLYIGLLSGYYLLLKKVVKRDWQIFTGVVLLALSPLVVSQLNLVMMDLLQVMLLVWYLVWQITYLQTPSPKAAALTGVFLGLFSAVKFPLYTPFLLLISIIFTWWAGKQKKKLLYPLLLTTAVGVSFVSTYLPFILQTSVSSFLSLLKWMVSFYLSGEKTGAFPGVALVTLGSGWFTGWWGEGWQRFREWSPILPISFIGGVYYWWKMKKLMVKNVPATDLLLLVVGSTMLGLFLVIPFWPRYLILIIPILLIFLVKSLPSYKFGLALITLELVWLIILLFFPTPNLALSQFTNSWQIAAFADMYPLLSSETKYQFSSQSFIQPLDSFVEQAEVKSISIDYQPMLLTDWISSNHVQVPINVKYKTAAETLEHQTTLTLKRNLTAWQVYSDPKTLIDKNQIPNLKQDENMPVISVIPDELEHWQDFFELRPLYTSRDIAVELLAIAPGRRRFVLGPVEVEISTEELEQLTRKKGIYLE
jgi:hypothetical protein